MGKRLEDLNLSDEPIRPVKPVDPRETEWYTFAREIDEMLETTTAFEWAADTLMGIRESVEQYQTVTAGQRRAVANIQEAGTKTGGRRSRSFRRRYW